MLKLMIKKATALVLFWTFCLSISAWSMNLLPLTDDIKVKKYLSNVVYVTLSGLLFVFFSFVLIFSGWLADQRFGNFKIFRAGCALMFLGSVAVSLCILDYFNNQKVLDIIKVSSSITSVSGMGAVLVTVFQLGLDQMPDASSVGITSFILIFFIVAFFGVWFVELIFTIVICCTRQKLSVPIVSLLPVLCTCIVLTSLFLFSKKWLIIEPKSPQSLKNIYRVLKFAAKHKAPLNRSALTYWEEDIPSRLDLGKSRYGGPFTTEQVEDVKTFFRLLLMFLPWWIIAASAYMVQNFRTQANFFAILKHQNQSSGVDHIYEEFMVDPWWCSLVTLFLYTVCVYPCFKHKLPSILKRVSLYLFLVVVQNIAYAAVVLLLNSFIWVEFAHTWLLISLLTLGLVTSVEFVCAQSPYSMRGLLSGIYSFIVFASFEAAALVSDFLNCPSKHCLITLYSTGCGLGIVGFLLNLVMAYRYKRRVRDEEYNPYPVIEATYDRYLTQAQRMNSPP